MGAGCWFATVVITSGPEIIIVPRHVKRPSVKIRIAIGCHRVLKTRQLSSSHQRQQFGGCRIGDTPQPTLRREAERVFGCSISHEIQPNSVQIPEKEALPAFRQRPFRTVRQLGWQPSHVRIVLGAPSRYFFHDIVTGW